MKTGPGHNIDCSVSSIRIVCFCSFTLTPCFSILFLCFSSSCFITLTASGMNMGAKDPVHFFTSPFLSLFLSFTCPHFCFILDGQKTGSNGVVPQNQENHSYHPQRQSCPFLSF
ncbi:MAG: hypothetical protein JOS17DRAFT_745098 [Linnemannia elongata]|nr:MAG: hypothetical protein JOS17DRAFT_745098 [Linnemannia elongata]